MQKLYCYVDETGQDTQGELFIVSVVVTARERDAIVELCEDIERETGKGRVKWIKAHHSRRVAYIRRILQDISFKGKLNFAVYRNSKEYLALTVLTVARAIFANAQKEYKTTVLIDGLPRAQEKWVGSELRRLRVQVRKVRGVRKDENDALVRLADALCGFVREAIEGNAELKELLERGKQSGWLREL